MTKKKTKQSWIGIGIAHRKTEAEANVKRFLEKQWQYGRKKPKTKIKKGKDGFFRSFTEK